jgi:deoxyribodipyrimidine photolyase-like uncharacterized protein
MVKHFIDNMLVKFGNFQVLMLKLGLSLLSSLINVRLSCFEGLHNEVQLRQEGPYFLSSWMVVIIQQ